MFSDIGNLDIVLGGNYFERDGREFSNSVRRPASPSYKTSINKESNSHSNSKENEIRNFAGHGHNSGGTESDSEFKRLSGELNQRITQEMNNLMSSVSSLIQ